MRYLRLTMATFSASLKRELAFRANLLMALIEALIGAVMVLATIEAVFSQTASLAGWTRAEGIVLLGTFQIVSGLIATFVEPNLRWFAGRVRNGDLDVALLKPVAGLFTISLGSHAPLGLSQVLVGLVVTRIGIQGLEMQPSAGAMVAWLLLIVMACLIAWAVRVMLALFALWFPSLTLDVLFDALWQFGRYPIGVFDWWLQRLLTWVIPLACFSSIPAQTLTQGPNLARIIAMPSGALVAVSLTILIWNQGIRRYTSATS